MLPTRFIPGQSSAVRKSRIEGKPSLLPKLRGPGSIDRLSSEVKRPSTTGHRSSSAEPPRATFGSRQSREASATKLPLNRRSKSQQVDARYGQAPITPLRSSHYSRSTTTPVRTPSEDRSSRSWKTSLERALAFVTIKDSRTISNPAWQRSECARVQEILSSRGDTGGAPLLRPLTIARFVDITNTLLAAITRDAKLNNDNYITKLPHIAKRLLYPGAVSKSWLRTVNTLHAFPHALALIAYLLDMAMRLELPVLDEWLYVGKDELASLRRDYLYKCWIRFQDPGHEFEDLNDEYLQNLKQLLGNDEAKISELQQVVKKYEACLEDEAETAARADEARRTERRAALLQAIRQERAGRMSDRTQTDAKRETVRDAVDIMRSLDLEIEKANAEGQQLRREVEQQIMTVSERTQLLEEVDYANRVQDSKRALAEQIHKMLMSKETELALWQKMTLDSCVEYKQGLIHMSAQYPELANLAVDEKELMEAECLKQVSNSVSTLKAQLHALSERRVEQAKARNALSRKRHHLLEETKEAISEAKASLQREQQALDAEISKETAEAIAWNKQEEGINVRLDDLKVASDGYSRICTEAEFWEAQDQAWRTKLSSMRDYIEQQRAQAQELLQKAKEKRATLLINHVSLWNDKLEK